MVVHTTRPLLRSLDLTYTPPKGTVARWFWAKRMRLESTFAISMLEPWEKLLVLFMLVVLTYLLTNSVVHFLPQHLILLKQRVIYYLEGEL